LVVKPSVSFQLFLLKSFKAMGWLSCSLSHLLASIACSEALRQKVAMDVTQQRALQVPRTSSVAPVQKSQSQIFYVVRTCEAVRHERIPSILDTWAGPVKESLLMVSEKGLEEPKIYAADGCSSDHWKGLVCKTGYGFALAAKLIGNHSWVMLLDDDVYVNTSNLERELRKHDASQLVALGVPGCGTPHCIDKMGGFCGGGGYAISKPALKAFVDKLDPKQVGAKMLELRSIEHEQFDDIVATCLMKKRGVKVQVLKGLYPWRLDDKKGETSRSGNPASLGALQLPSEASMSSEYNFAIHEDAVSPLTFHYIKPAEMYLLHDEFERRGKVASSLLQAGHTESSRYDVQKEQFVKMRNA